MTRQSIHDRIMSREAEPEGGARRSGTGRNRRWARAGGFLVAGVLLVAAGVYAGVHHRQILGTLGMAVAADTEAADDAGDGDAPAGEAARETTPFMRHASEAGVMTCSGLFAALGDMLTAGSSYGVQSFWNHETPDAHPMQAVVGMSYETEHYSGPAAGYVFATPDGSECEGSMVRVAPYALPCDEIPSILPEESERINALKEVAVYSLGERGQALLLPMADACVVVSVASGAHRSANQNGARQ